MSRKAEEHMSELRLWIFRSAAVGAGLACGVITFMAVVALIGAAYEAIAKAAAKLYRHIRYKHERRVYERKRKQMEVIRAEREDDECGEGRC